MVFPVCRPDVLMAQSVGESFARNAHARMNEGNDNPLVSDGGRRHTSSRLTMTIIASMEKRSRISAGAAASAKKASSIRSKTIAASGRNSIGLQQKGRGQLLDRGQEDQGPSGQLRRETPEAT